MSDLVSAIIERWSLNLITDLVRYAVFAIGVWLVLWVALAWALEGRKIRKDRPPLRQLLVEFAISIRSVAIFSTVGLGIFLVERAGYLAGPEIARGLGPIWFCATVLGMILAHDAYFYWTHRLMHRPRAFRTFHRRHHKSHNPSPFTAYSFDLAEAAVMATFVPLWMLLVPTEWPAVGLFMLHQIARNTLGHSGYELMPARADGRPWFDWLTTTTHHDLHHAEAGWNYGLYFTWWDRWMGTEHPDYHARFAAAVRKPRPARGERRGRGGATVAAGLMAGLALLAAPGGDAAAAQAGHAVYGDWATPGLGGVVRLEPCAAAAERLCGRLTWLWAPEGEGAAALGRDILSDFLWRDGAWREGRVANPEDGRVYRGTIQLEGGALKLRGCAGPFCQTQVWRRLSDIPRPDHGR